MSTENFNISWPGWETVKLIGRGSFGAVYEIERILEKADIEEKAALKVISIPQNASDIEEMYNDGYDNESITETFNGHLKNIVAEYSLMKKMNDCVNIVNCDDIRYIQHDDGIGWDIFIKMELLTPLTKSLPETISDDIVIKLGSDICNALVTCKKFDVVHRDIKPQNIFISPNGDYKLGDFGIAKTIEKTMGGTKIGTYKYMAPEVYNNQPYGSGADIYSLGLVLYWLLNERRMPFLPFPPEKIGVGKEEEARHRRLSGEILPPPKHGSEKLKQIVLKACAYDPKDRFSSAVEMFEALNNINVTEKINNTPIVPIVAADFGIKGDEKVVDEHPVDPSVHNPASKQEPHKPICDPSTGGANKKNVAIISALAVVIIAVIVGFAISNNRDNVDVDLSTEEVSEAETSVGYENSEKLLYEYLQLIDSQPVSEDLSAPLITDSESTENSIKLKWAKITEASGYRIYIYNENTAKYERVETTLQNSSEYVVGNLEPGTTYKFKVKAYKRMSEDSFVWSVASVDFEVSTDGKLPEETTTEETTTKPTTTKPTTTKPTTTKPTTTKPTTTKPTTTEPTTTKPTTTKPTTTELTTTEPTTTEPTTTESTTIKSDVYGPWSEWSTDYVAGSDSRQVQTKKQYSYRDISYKTEYTPWGGWSSWQDSAVSETDLIDVETRTIYPFYYFYCTSCGRNARFPYWNITCEVCRVNKIKLETGTVEWFTNTWASSTPWGSGTGKNYQYINGGIWWNWTDGSPKTQYQYRTRSTTQVPVYSNWSEYSDTVYAKSATREVRDRTVYRYRDKL